MFSRLRDPVSGLTHFIGVLLSVVGLVLLVYASTIHATVWHVVAFSVFGASLILLYTASTLYHLLPLTEKGIKTLRKIDHMMIFVLIAGTYTPICLIPLRGIWGWSLLGIIWGLTAAGIVMKVVWLNAPRWLYTSIYIAMGWMVAVAFLPLLRTVPVNGLVWLAAGGIFYSIGAVIYGMKRPNFSKIFLGFHEIFHLFVMAGSLSHFWMMYRFVLNLR